MTDTLDRLGYFRLVDYPDKQVPGRIFWDSKNSRLDLLESLEEMQAGKIPSVSETEDGVTILANTRLGPLILVNCQREPELCDGYRVGSILNGVSGEVLTQNKGLWSDWMQVRLNLLNEWVGRIDTTITGDTREAFSVNYPPHILVEYPFQWGKVALSVSYMHHLLSSQAVTSNHRILVSLDSPRSLDDLSTLKSAVQRLLTLAMDSPCLIEGAIVRIGEERGPWLENTVGNDLVERRSTHSPFPLFSYADIGNVKGIAKWLDLYLRYWRAINVLTSHHYMNRMFTGNRYINFMIAIERLAVQKHEALGNDHSVKRRVACLANELTGTIFDDLVGGQIPQWIKVAVDIRNTWVAHGNDNIDIDDWKVYAFSESLYFLGLIWLLKECGMPEPVFESIRRSGEFNWVKERVRPYLQ